MKKIILSIVFTFFILAPLIGSASDFRPHQLTLQEKRFDFSQLLNQINNQYGPKLFKKQQLGIDINALAREYWEKIKETQTNGEFYTLIVQFVAEFRDGHFQARIPTTLKAYLPFDVTKVGDRVVIEYVSRNRISEEDFPFERGDELLSMDSRPVAELIREFVPYVASGNPRSAEGTATYFLTYRNGRTLPVPQGKVLVTLKKRGTNEIATLEMEWKREGTEFDEHSLSEGGATDSMKAMMMPDIPQTQRSEMSIDAGGFDPEKLSALDIVSEIHPEMENSYHCNGGTRIHIPEDATILIERPFIAYYHPTEKGNIGYLRIPHYWPPNEAFEEWLEKYTWALTKLEEETAGLIIDQDHNCGGSISFLENIVSLFMEEEFSPLEFQFRASKRELLTWERYMSGFDSPHYLWYDGLLEVYKLIEESIGRGLYLTPKISFRGSQKVQPMAVYTKPVIILADYFAGSCGDAFPAMMQGTGRANILGTTTWGLGGHVVAETPLFYSQINTRMTQSLFYHPDGTPIENHGVTPDIEYEITLQDFMNEYKDYQRFYLSKLFKMIE